MSLKIGGQIAIVAIKSAVAKTGNTALTPGKAVFSSKYRDEMTIPSNPIQGKNLFPKTLLGIKSKSAPIPSSQARVGSE
ncbi:unannotated protein [freshwater metagenome]|uniref:Unannotated protein n=1 Tax=freshwater metagenome TaxID=449393 RepID=A0A6J7V1K1_9ZZZZ